MFAIAVVVILLGAGWFYWMVKRKRADQLLSEWQGVVTDKIPVIDAKQARQYVSVTLDGGRRMFVEVSTALWKTLEDGDKLVKRAGEPEPKKDDGAEPDEN